ncbi:IclR family transcriptional regulator [Microbacterium sp. NPDC089696]|uniref:IclR family transcriptional regulator n=1 Tax=Microbacterium sp. NPDC089696 TaxID=3364199 RepID=UPI0037F7FB4E
MIESRNRRDEEGAPRPSIEESLPVMSLQVDAEPETSTSSLSRALSLLDAFSVESPEFSIRELSRRSGVPRSTTHRLVDELIKWGALERGADGVRLGVKLFELGSRAPTQTTLREATTASLHALSEVCKLTANLAVRDGDRIVYLDKITSPALRVPHSRFGGRGYLHATALGKAILAYSSTEIVDDLLRDPLPRIAARTIVDPDRLRAEFATIRRTGVAYDVEESRTGLFCVSAPILDRRGQPLAALSVTGATAFAQAEKYAPAVLATARAVSRRLAANAAR